jgi:hypothetical protein
MKVPDNLADPPVDVLIPELAVHEFCTFQGTDELGCDSVQNDNVFKTNPGVAGLTLELKLNAEGFVYEEPLAGVLVELKDSNGQTVGSDYSDEEGWYQIIYKHKGRPEQYTFEASRADLPTFTRIVELQGNEFEEVMVYLDNTGGAADLYVHIESATPISKVGPKTWNAKIEMMIVDQDGLPVANAQVSGTWDTGDTALCVSDALGVCTVDLVKLDKGIASVTLTVLDVAADGYLYDPTDNPPPTDFTVTQ